MTSDHKPSIGSLIRFADGCEAEVIAHTERGFRYQGNSHPFIAREGSHFFGEGEIYTDTPEYRLGVWGFTVVKQPTKSS